MDPSIAENKMEDSGATGESGLEGSVSFGKNKSLEEVGKCPAFGSVAQKKAYFEAQYKNMAVRKAEEEDKDNNKRGGKPRDLVDFEHQTRVSHYNAVEPELDNAIELEGLVKISICETQSKGFVIVDEIIESEDPIPLTDDIKDESCSNHGTPELTKAEEAPVEESPKHIDDIRASDEKDEMGKAKSEKSVKSLKATSVKREARTVSVKKTHTSSTPKSSVIPNSKLSRSTLSKSVTPTPKALSKKANNETSPFSSKKTSSVEGRRVAPTSLHMSLNLEPAMSTTMRKSLIMESMGDKDIVKRAFKAFRNNSSPVSSPSPVKPSATGENPGKETDAKASIVGTPLKKTEGGNKLVKKSSPLSGHTGLGKTSNPTRVSNTVVADQRNNKSVSSRFGPRSRDKTDQGNKVSKKLEDKVNGKPFERTQLQSKEKKELEIKRQQNSYNTKTKPISGTFASRIVT